MPFQVRCPECRAKLRLDDEPSADEAIECPRCGTHFDPTAARLSADAAPKKKRKESAAGTDRPAREKTAVKDKKPKADANAPKKKRAKKKKSNKTLLAIMIGGALAVLTGIGLVTWILVSSTGKLESMLVHVPGDCNLVRGVNVGHISKYAGYKSELDRAFSGPLRTCWIDVASGLGLSGDAGESPEYAVQGKVKTGGTAGTVYVYRTRLPIDPNALGSALGGSATQAGGETYYQLPAQNGPLNRAAVYAPSDRVIVVVADGPQKADLIQKSAAGKLNPEGSFWGRMGKTGQQVTSGHIWTLVRAEGDLRDYIAETVKPIAPDFKPLADQGAKSPLFGIWTSFGGKITFGAAIQCDSPEAASAVVESIRNSPVGSGDETEELPNSLKNAFGQLRSKEMSEFRSNLKFYSTGDCAYLRTQMTMKDKAQQALQIFANPNLAEGGASGGGFGPGGMGPMPGGFGPPGGAGPGP